MPRTESSRPSRRSFYLATPYRVGIGDSASRADLLDHYPLVRHLDALRALSVAAEHRRSAAVYRAAGHEIFAETAVRRARLALAEVRACAGDARRAGFRLPGALVQATIASATGLVVTLVAA